MLSDPALSFYATIPSRIDPIAFSVGFLKIHWYSMMYILAFLAVYLLLMHRIRRKEFPISNFQFPIKSSNPNYKLQNILEDFIIYSFLGVIIGGRLGYVLFYNLPYYLNNPTAIISPFGADGNFIGLYGMSYHGGLVGVLLAAWYFCKKNKIGFWQWADFVVPAIPAGFFFGRVGNFLNGELYGRITQSRWGMDFGDGMLRHPSQLYEAFFEGLVLFVILWWLRNKSSVVGGKLLVIYLFLYGSFRFFVEFFREPDPQLGFILKYGALGLTLGQLLSLGMIISAIFIFIYSVRSKKYENKKV